MFPIRPKPLGPERDPYHAYDGVIMFHPSSDTLVRVGDRFPNKSPRRYCITSSLVARASPVLATMLFGRSPDVPASTDNPRYLYIPNEHPEFMGLLLCTIHGYPRTFKGEVSLDKDDDWNIVFSVVALAIKYQCLTVLGPWAPEWTAAINTRITSLLPATVSPRNPVALSSHGLYPTLAAIAFMLGCRQTFQRVMTAMVISYPLDHFKSAPPLDAGVVTLAKLEDCVRFHRAELLQELRTYLEYLVAPSRQGIPSLPNDIFFSHGCVTLEERSTCAAYNLEILSARLKEHGIIEWRDPTMTGVLPSAFAEGLQRSTGFDVLASPEHQFACPSYDQEIPDSELRQWMNTGAFAFRKTCDDYLFNSNDADIKDMAQRQELLAAPYPAPGAPKISHLLPRTLLL